jgi:transcriptional regulator with XRE-family HTH domain
MLLRGLIGTVLRRIRLGQGRTLRDVADTARVSVPYLSEVERGRKEPSSELLAAICTALDLQLADLLDEVRFEIARGQVAELPLPAQSITGLVSIRHAPTRPSALSSWPTQPSWPDQPSWSGQPSEPARPSGVSVVAA